jgi:hypothetical protein
MVFVAGSMDLILPVNWSAASIDLVPRSRAAVIAAIVLPMSGVRWKGNLHEEEHAVFVRFPPASFRIAEDAR